MKDRAARYIAERLAHRMGCYVDWDCSPPKLLETNACAKGDLISRANIAAADLKDRVTLAETRLTKIEEAARPTCKSCGQKIQDGFREGDRERVIAEVRKEKR